MKQATRIALFGIIALAATNLLQYAWSIIILCTCDIDEFGYIETESLEELILYYDTIFDICYYLTFVNIAGWVALLYFFYKLYNIQSSLMKKTSLCAIYGIILILIGILYFAFAQELFDFSNTLAIICHIFEIVGFILIIPFFYTLYKKSK